MLYPGGYYVSEPVLDIKTSHAKPSKTTIAMFQALQHNKLIKKELVEILCAVNCCPFHQGFYSSTISWHTNTGRIKRVHKNGRSTFSITDIGLQYAKDRGII